MFSPSNPLWTLLLIILFSTPIQSNWPYRQRNLRYLNGMENQMNEGDHARNIKKTFLPPRYQNLWGQGESSKVVDNSALSPQKLDDFKMQTQQKQVFAWQPQQFSEW